MKIKTSYDPPPIPTWRKFAWSAIEDGYEPNDPIGFGATEQEAIDDLKEQIELEDAVWASVDRAMENWK